MKATGPGGEGSGSRVKEREGSDRRLDDLEPWPRELVMALIRPTSERGSDTRSPAS